MAEASKEETGKEFGQRLGPIVTHGFISLAVSIGLQSGIFDVLVDLHDEERSSQEIADAAGLKERYVREWLGAMVVARIVDINPETEKYRLPLHRVPYFKAGSDLSDLALLTTALPMLSNVYKKLSECLKKDGPSGLSYSEYRGFHSFMADVNGRWITNHLVQDFVPSMPKIERQLKSGIKVLDLGCGRGVCANLFAKTFPQSSIAGIDCSQECIDFARNEAKQKGLFNVEYVCGDAAHLPAEWTDTFDYIFAHDVIHDLPNADQVLKETHRVLKPGGTFSMVEPDSQSKQADNIHAERIARMYTISLFHCLPVSMYFEGSLGLGTAWGREKATEFLIAAGFEVESITKPPRSVQAHYICSKIK